MRSYDVHYFNSEMGPGELRKRLSNFDDYKLSDWKFKAYERSDNFHDAIKSGTGKLNIIDFLEVHEDFWKVGGMLSDIHKKLDGAVAIVALQKNRVSDLGLGASRGLEKPRLYISVGNGLVKIVKGKNWATSENPNGLQRNFKIAAGCKLIPSGDWYREDKPYTKD